MIRDKKASFHSCAVPEDMEVLRKPLVLSSAEVFQQVDSRIPGLPPSYEQATQSTPLSSLPPAGHSMTVQEAQRLSGVSTVCRTRSISESNFKAPAKSLLRRCSQPLFEELMHARESYV